MVIVSHISYHGFYQPGSGYVYISNLPNRLMLQMLNTGSLGVDIFVMMSGFFLAKRDSFSLRKVLSLIIMVWFYSVIIYVIFVNTGLISFSWKECVTAYLPTTFGVNWFFTAYLTIYMISPFLNKILNNSKSLPEFNLKKDFSGKDNSLSIILIMFLFWSVIPTLSGGNHYATDIPVFIMLYLIGGYIRNNLQYLRKAGNFIFVITVIIWVLMPVIAWLTGIRLLQEHITFFTAKNSVVTVLLSAAIIIKTAYCKAFYNKFINWLALGVFGIYLISDNYYIRIHLYKFLHCKEYANSPELIMLLVIWSIGIFCFCSLIDYCRRIIFNKLLQERKQDES